MGNCSTKDIGCNENEALDSICVRSPIGRKKNSNNETTNTNRTQTSSPSLVMERGDSSNATVWKLTKRQEDDCEEIFSVFEEDDGMIHISHIGPMMRALNCKPSEAEINSVMNRFENQNGGKINFQTFLQIMAPRVTKANEVYSEEKIEAAFHRFDKDHNGYITASELRLALQENFCTGMKRVAEALTDEDVEEIMNEADLDGDGRISFGEFKEMIPHLSDCIHTSVKIK